MAITVAECKRIEQILSGNCIRQNVCPVKDIMAAYGDKWSMFTILLLGQHGKRRFSELRGSITGISQRMLTVTLRALEQNGIIKRTLYPQIPPRIEYSLTTLGESLFKQVFSMAAWAEDNFEAVLNARQEFKTKHVAAG